MYHLGRHLGRDCISASYLIKYAHNGRSCDLRVFSNPEINFWIRAFKFGRLRALRGTHDICSVFCRIPLGYLLLNMRIMAGHVNYAFGICEVNLLVRAFNFGMLKEPHMRTHDASPAFRWISVGFAGVYSDRRRSVHF